MIPSRLSCANEIVEGFGGPVSKLLFFSLFGLEIIAGEDNNDILYSWCTFIS